MRTCPNPPWVQVYRGKTAEQGDAVSTSITWQPVMRLNGNEAGTIGLTEVLAMIPWIAGGRAGGRVDGIMFYTREAMGQFMLPNSKTPFCLTTEGIAVTAYEDWGTPDSPHEPLSIELSGTKIDANHQVDVYYRTDSTAAWTLAEANIQTSPHNVALTGITCYRMQLKVVFHAVLHDQKTDAGVIAIRARELRNLNINLKREYALILELGDGQVSSKGYAHPSGLMQITALETLLGAGSTSFIDPLGVARTVTIEGVETGEVLQAEDENPVITAQVTLMEV